MRVYELAKELRLTSKQLLVKIHELGASEVKNPAASLTDAQADQVREALRAASKPLPVAAGAPSALTTRRTAALQRSRATQAAVSEARRRTRVAAPSSAAAAVAARMRQSHGRSAVAAPMARAVPAAPGASPDAKAAPERRPAERSPKPDDRRPPTKGKKGAGGEVDLVVPTIEVMKLDETRKGTGRRRGKSRRTRDETPGRPRRDRIAPSFILSAPRKRPARPRAARGQTGPVAPQIHRIHGDLTVGQFAQKIGVPISTIIKSLMEGHGQMLTLNQTLPQDLIELLAIELEVEVEIVPEGDDHDVKEFLSEDAEHSLQPRPPVVTVMGHVDHGKTSLLDVVRKTSVVEGEYGGITQHIGAYVVETQGGNISFLDTPGHEAFTSMRARGARVTDIVVLVVAADDPIMPQTIEAIDHAREAGVPIVVAINKIDLPTANVQRITTDLMGRGLVPENQGGDTIFCEVSAKQAIGIEALLEAVLLQAEILELKSNPDRSAIGTVIESYNDPQRGVVSTVLIQKGTLRVGDSFVVGQQPGRVKAMFDDCGKALEEAGASIPAEILGIDGVPEAGEMLLVMATDRTAREIAETRAHRRRVRGLEHRRHVSLENLKERVDEGEIKELKLILKADVQGSAEAICQLLERIVHEEIRVRILHAGVGGIGESDVALADASDAVIIGFNIRPDVTAAEEARRQNVEIKTYRVIYDLIDEVKSAMVGMMDKRFREITRGRAEVREIFRVSKVGSVAGSYVSTGEIARGNRARLLRQSVVVYDGQISNLRRFKDDVSSVQTGLECGIGLQDYQDIKEGDEIEVYDLEEVQIQL
jgi:translation initiation factor IF-2